MEYPSHDIDPKLKKQSDWMLKNAKAFWYDVDVLSPRTMFNAKRADYDLWRLYGMGKQPNGKYKPLMGVDKDSQETYINISWDISPFYTHLRDILITKVMAQGFRIVATPADMAARDESNNYYAETKAKLMMQQQAMQIDPALAAHPVLALGSKDPRDLEELETRYAFGEQFNRAENAELCCDVMLFENKFVQIDREMSEDLVDWGVTGLIDDLDCNGKPVLRRADARHLMVSRCNRSDFSDMTRWAEIIEVSKTDLQQYFTVEQLKEVNNGNAYGVAGFNTSSLNGTQDLKGKVKVMHMEFFSTDGIVWESNIDRNGNVAMPKADYSKRNSKNPKYVTKSVKMVYTCKWVVGTDLIYDYGLKNDMKRSVDNAKKSETTLSLHLQAFNFHEMMAQGFTERVVSTIDDIQLDIYKLRNFKNRMIPNGFYIDMSALEDVAIGKGGTNMTPMQLIDMYVQSGIAVGRRKDMDGATNNDKPFDPRVNSMVNELVGLANEIQRNMAMLTNMLGLNEVTDGSTPNPKMLNGVATMVAQNTNNALFPIVNARKTLIEVACGEMMKRLQQCLRRNGGYKGFVPALNSNTLRMVEADKDLALRDFAIRLELKPTDEQKQMVVNIMMQDIQNGFLDTSDIFTILNVYNMKQAEQMLAFKVKKNKEKAQQNAMQQQQMNGQVQMQSNQQTSQNRLAEIQAEAEAKAYLIKLEKDLELRNKQMELQGTAQIADNTNKTKVTNQLITANTKKDIERMKQGMNEPNDPIELGSMETVAPMPPMMPMGGMNNPQEEAMEQPQIPQEEMAEMEA